MALLPVTCAQCGRKANVPEEQLAKRRCPYCGGAFSGGATPAPGPAPEAAGRPMNISCGVCGNPFRYPAVLPGKPMECKYCGSPFLAPDKDGPSRDSGPEHGVPSDPVKLPCPACGEVFSIPGTTLAGPIDCPLCKKNVDLASTPLDALFDFGLPPPSSRLVSMIGAALAARWKNKLVCAAEAASTLRTLAIAETWRPSGETASPFAVELTAESVKYLILALPEAILSSPHVSTRLLQVKLQREGGFPWDRLVKGNGHEMIRASINPTWKDTVPGAKRPEAVRDQLFLLFSENPDGCTLDAHLQRKDGNPIPVQPEDIAPLRNRIRESIRNAVCAYLGFRSLFGMWASIRIQQAAQDAAISSRIAALGGAFAPEKDILTKAIKRR
jgi:DNA-directed RNA polymerase subunit RPC12/RpoP